jgi:hypothetical protein
MLCLPFESSISIDVLWLEDFVSVTVHQDENLTFKFLINEAVSLFLACSPHHEYALKFVAGRLSSHLQFFLFGNIYANSFLIYDIPILTLLTFSTIGR